MESSTNKSRLGQIEAAIQSLGSGSRADAVATYESISEADDLDAAAHYALGRLCLALEGSFLAVQHLEKAVAGAPDNAEYLGLLGIALQTENRGSEAAAAFEKALELNENMPSVLNSLGIISGGRGDYEKARLLLEKAVLLKPSDGVIQTNFAMALANVNDHDTALKHAKKGLKLAPDDSNAHYTYGSLLAHTGQVDDAIRHFEGTIRKNRLFGGAYDHLARIKKFTPDDKPFIEKVEKTLQQGMPAQDRMCIHFALGKMYDDCQQYDNAFEHYSKANLLKKKNYDGKEDRRSTMALRKLVDAKLLQQLQRHGSDSIKPIFIVGMPRSGTTLMERMITSNVNVAGAGELHEIPHIVSSVLPADNVRQFAAAITEKLDADGVQKYAEQYLTILRQTDANADRVVDKLPENYRHVWLLSILFPKATIIFAQRHPLDVALSCYFQNFAAMPWADDFRTIADEYRFHRETMDYWKKILPDGKIIDVHYERLVAEPDVYGKQMLEDCGLEWSGDGLEQYKKNKVVNTASVWQVRQPVYLSSRQRWKNYAPHLGELAKLMSEFLQDDREELGACGIEISGPSSMQRLKKLFA